MNILQINYYDNLGGAARIAWLLHQEFRALGHHAWMAVARKFSSDPFVKKIPVLLPQSQVGRLLYNFAVYAEEHDWSSGYRNLAGVFHRLAEPGRYWQRYTTGREDFNFPGSRTILDLISEIPDVIHFHNLHLNYFDLSYLPVLSQRFPTLITLHDMWMLTGHCAHSMDCERWKTGCGHCPYLNTYPAFHHDNTACNWQRKKDFYSRSRLYAVAPSSWMIRNAEQSMLALAMVDARVIPNGVDLSIFRPSDKFLVRKELGLPPDALVILFVAAGSNPGVFKDFATMRDALKIVSSRWIGRKIIFIALGGRDSSSRIGDTLIVNVPYINDSSKVAQYYQASDIYIHASRAETFPNVIIEAQACGTPVIATSTGGIPETLEDGKTGFLTKTGNPLDMAERIIQLLEDKTLCESMGVAAGNFARDHFSRERMLNSYLNFYQEILQEWKI